MFSVDCLSFLTRSIYLSYLPCIKIFCQPPAASCPVNRNITNDECLLLESFQGDERLSFEVYDDVTLTEYLETSSPLDQIFRLPPERSQRPSKHARVSHEPICFTSQQHARVSHEPICFTSQQHARVSHEPICFTSQQHARVSHEPICCFTSRPSHASVSHEPICFTSQQHASQQHARYLMNRSASRPSNMPVYLMNRSASRPSNMLGYLMNRSAPALILAATPR